MIKQQLLFKISEIKHNIKYKLKHLKHNVFCTVVLKYIPEMAGFFLIETKGRSNSVVIKVRCTTTLLSEPFNKIYFQICNYYYLSVPKPATKSNGLRHNNRKIQPL